MLEVESGIAPWVMADRGYRTVRANEKRVLRDLGFANYQLTGSGLLIPEFDDEGRLVGHQFRPDTPRRNKEGKEIKYDIPVGSATVIDVPKSCQHMLHDLNVPLVLTEGCKKADSAASRGICCLSLMGVWSFYVHTINGRILHPTLARLPLKGRLVIICFDSDVMSKEEVRSALDVLRLELEKLGAIVRYALLEAPNK